MAGVIASVSLHNEKDTRAVAKQFSVSKSNYILPEFDRTFQPIKHNIFYIRQVEAGLSSPDSLYSGEPTTWTRGRLSRTRGRRERRDEATQHSQPAGSVWRSA